MPNWGLSISIDQLGYPRASIRDVVQLASTFHRDAALRILGMYNLSVSLAAAKFEGREEERLKVQTALLRNSISESRLPELKARFFNADLLKQPIFHRQQLLTMLKLIAKFGRSSGGNPLERREDFDTIAELALQTNSLLPNTFESYCAHHVKTSVNEFRQQLESVTTVLSRLVAF